jgi:hypothetical protein
MNNKISNGVKNKFALLILFLGVIFLAGISLVSAQDASNVNMSDTVTTGTGEGNEKVEIGFDCGEGNAGTCVEATFSCPSGQEFVSGGDKNCRGLNARCCKKSSGTATTKASDTTKTGGTGNIDPNGTNSKTKTVGNIDPGSVGVKPLGKIDIPTDLGLPNNTVAGVLKNLLSWLLGIVGILALMGFLISGIQYLLAYSNEELAETAKRNMTYSVMGITIALAGFIIIQAINLALQGTPWF